MRRLSIAATALLLADIVVDGERAYRAELKRAAPAP